MQAPSEAAQRAWLAAISDAVTIVNLCAHGASAASA
jgi:hypothetical protein